MGHGASTNTKKIRIEANDVTQIDNVVWNRSNSDGCIVETLNSSRTKVDLLEQQVYEYRDLLQLAEENYGKAQREADRFKKQLSETESAKLEIMDRMEDLEDEINNLRSQIEADSSQELSRLIQVKDQEIESLQANVEKLTRDIKVVKAKCKERVKAMKSKLVESKQDYSMRIYQMKEELRMMEDENRNLSENRVHSSTSPASERSGSALKEDEEADSSGDPRNNLIVELSNQVSQQEILILDLTEKLRIKDGLLESKSVSSRSGTRSFSAGDKGRTTHTKEYSSSTSRDQRDPHRETDQRNTKGSSSRKQTSKLKSGLGSDIIERSKSSDLETEICNPSRPPGLLSAKDGNSKLSSSSGSYGNEIDELLSHPEDRDKLMHSNHSKECNGQSEDANWNFARRTAVNEGVVHESAGTDGLSPTGIRSASSSRETFGNSLHRGKKPQKKLRKLSPLVGVKKESQVPGSPVDLNVTTRDFDRISLESGILSLDSFVT